MGKSVWSRPSRNSIMGTHARPLLPSTRRGQHGEPIRVVPVRPGAAAGAARSRGRAARDPRARACAVAPPVVAEVAAEQAPLGGRTVDPARPRSARELIEEYLGAPLSGATDRPWPRVRVLI